MDRHTHAARRSRLLLALSAMLLSTAAATVTTSARAGEATVLDRVVAVVNDDVVLLSELERELMTSPILAEALGGLGPRPLQAQIEKKTEEVRMKVLEDLIERQLIRREAARLQIPVSEADVDRYLRQMAKENQFETVEELRQAVVASGEFGSWGDYKQMIRNQILVQVTTSYLTNYKVTEAQVREHYRKMARDVDAKIELEQLAFIADQRSSETRDKIYAQAQAIARRLRAGEAFETIAAELGQTEKTHRSLARGEIAPQLEDAIFAAKTGQVVGPLASGRGYVVYIIVEREETDVRSFEQAKSQIRMMLEMQAFERASREFREQLRAKAHIDVRL
jgi:peptidyl-prolyl cis-trans isomerase SurA